ncbi:class I SAM-dependent methyltransferase [Sedimentibacter sp. zth1]|uniref:class I SAM-dependent methyltransferase n=1 Tax=Sedimentibacter sp. zth1 TaxID=2816908 RepID=UPI001A917D9A|nr:class I SAM-dependent methyltransferase [Sedimentibacter sp. zth1]QSX06572.1 class I SAM-dependent methyltransferase [Sedimentibacter sp. zth1]
MNINYDKYIKVENDIYKGVEKISVPSSTDIGNEQLDKGLDWLCENTDKLLDFGCGSGSMLFSCALRGVKELIGIDMSDEGIKLCNNRAKLMKLGSYKFIQGTVNELNLIEDNSIDGAILSNVIDNIAPNDSMEVLKQIRRIVKKSGKILIKLNPYIKEDQIKEYNIKTIEGNLLDDGLLLWNQTTEEWRTLLLQYFNEKEYVDVYFKEYDQYNRMFLMINE